MRMEVARFYMETLEWLLKLGKLMQPTRIGSTSTILSRFLFLSSIFGIFSIFGMSFRTLGRWGWKWYLLGGFQTFRPPWRFLALGTWCFVWSIATQTSQTSDAQINKYWHACPVNSELAKVLELPSWRVARSVIENQRWGSNTPLFKMDPP